MNVKIAGHDRPVRAPGALPSPIGLLPASENAKWVGMLVSFALGLILSTAHIAGSPAPFGLAFLAAMGYGSGGALCLAGCALGYFAAFGVATGTQLAAGCCLIFLTAYFLRSHPFVQTRWYPSAVSAAAYILTRLVLCLLTDNRNTNRKNHTVRSGECSCGNGCLQQILSVDTAVFS